MEKAVSTKSNDDTAPVHPDGYQVGDRVNWLFRPRGGYGSAIPVAAVVERVGTSRVTIRVARRVFNGEWKIETKCVQTRFLSRRKTVCEQLGET